MKYHRILDLKKLTRTSSRFLFGPRGSGKSFLIRETFKEDALVINLLKTQDYFRLAENPSLLEDILRESKKKLVVIDEVQKLPSLLDEVHRLIEEKQIRFLLTGSSARRLKRDKANLLAGRARLSYLHPLTFHEIPQFDLEHYLLWGGLPEVNISQDKNDKREFLESYIETYLKEEIMAEQVARNLPNYSRFLKTAALCSGELINFAQVASDAQLSAATVKNYFEVVQDTLVGSLLEPWVESKKRKAIQTGKFYFFDVGVKNRLLNLSEIPQSSDLFGRSFEQFIFMELNAFRSYAKQRFALYFWRSVNHHEVDFLLGEQIAIEVKANKKVSPRDAKNLRILQEEGRHNILIVVSNDPINRLKDGILYLHWKEFLVRLWGQLGADQLRF